MKHPHVPYCQFSGELMGPESFRAFKRFFSLVNSDEAMTSGLLVGVGPEFWKMFNQDELPTEYFGVSAFETTGKRQVLVLSLQIGGNQCRLLLDLESPRVRELLSASRDAAVIKMLFHSGKIGDTMLYDYPIARETIDGLLQIHLATRAYVPWADTVEDVALLAGFLSLDDERMRIADAMAIREISVNEFATSTAAEERFEASMV
jgi:hypothetical protein